mmetsp:Transcript_7535/g.28313  ORF Transcript_7535/g.28313 Transcript_7535/m.28313 type:complete len:245 (+) Transcript_7535:87-821(+)
MSNPRPLLKSTSSLLKKNTPIFHTALRHYPGLARHYDWGGTHQKHMTSFDHLIFTPEQAREKALALYRRTLLELPFVKKQYNVPMSLDSMRKVVRKEFEKNRHVHHIAGKEQLLRQGYILLFEAKVVHLMNAHVYDFFSQGDFSQGILNDQQRVIEESVKGKNLSLLARSQEKEPPQIEMGQLVQYVASKFDELDLSRIARERERAYKDIVHLLIAKLPDFDVEGLLDQGLEEEIKAKMDQFLR